VLATVEEGPAEAKDATPGGPAKAGGEVGETTVRLRGVRAEGDVVVVRAGDELTAARITYDPNSHWIRAAGTDDNPAVYTAGPGSRTAGREFLWNTKTWKMRVVGASGQASGGGR
jgi:hypothetical protein